MTTIVAVLLMPLVLLGFGIAFGGQDADAFFAAAALAAVVLGLAWVFLYVRFRALFLRDAVKLAGASRASLPLVVESPQLVPGKPEVVVTMPVRTALGRHGKCQIELYGEGIRIWRGVERPEPRWELPYTAIVQVEAVDVVSVESMYNNNTETFVRLIAERPRIALLFGGGWISFVARQNGQAMLLMRHLEHHGVVSFDDETLAA